MLNDVDPKSFEHIYIAAGYTDLRRGIDGLSAIIENTLKLYPYDKCLFLFCGRRNDRIKGLLWEGDGFLLLYKRLETGKFRWPRTPAEARELSPREFAELMDGMRPDKTQGIPKVYPASIKNALKSG
ncbi:MAG: IS66 family insertion sequence element accessory protein TnpB [Lachnospiraceae bacterium]|nr:IS66 family insertion sequence element accessory protein TnpB [Lachnospiraceae bacterium]